MKIEKLLLSICMSILSTSFAFGQREYCLSGDSTLSRQRIDVDSLRHELSRINTEINKGNKHHDLDTLRKELSEVKKKLSDISEEAADIAQQAAYIYDVKSSMVQNGDYTLERGQTVYGNIKVLNGDAFINGSLKGSLIVVNGDVCIGEEGDVTGDVITINGRIRLKKGAQVRGSIIEQNGSRFKRTSKLTEKIIGIERSAIWDEKNFLFSRLAFNYNRVDGFFLGVGTKKEYFWSGTESYSPYGFVGYAFGLHKWRYQLGLDKWFGNVNRFEIGLEGHSLTDSKDYWIIGPKENMVFSLLAREDYMDYFSRTGGSLHLAQYYNMESRIDITYAVDKYESLINNTNWSIFGGKKSFRSNPAVRGGWMRSLIFGIDHRSKSILSSSRIGWKASLRGEATLGGDFNFRILSWNVARYQPLFDGAQLNLRIAGGTSVGDLPLQRTFQIGGFNTLNAFPYKIYTGNRMLLFNTEILLNPDVFNQFPLNLATLILFSDVGQVAEASSSDGMLDGWGAIKAGAFKFDFGVGFGDKDGSWRMFISWRTDLSSAPVLGVRLSRPF